MGSAGLWTIIGILLTFATLLSHVVYRTGHLTARVEEIERWRINIRQDLHEISDRMEEMNMLIKQLAVLIEERTERRLKARD